MKTANTLLLVLKGTDVTIDAFQQQMLKEMEVIFGAEMWDHVVVGVTFWPFDQVSVDNRNK